MFPGTRSPIRLSSLVLIAACVASSFLFPDAGFAAVENVVWTSLVNATASGNSVQKTGGCDGCEDAGGISQQELTAGDGYVEFTASEIDKIRFVGFNQGPTGVGAAGIDFAVRLGTGFAEVRENGLYRADTLLAPGDVFRVAVESGVVKYYKNGALLYTSTVAPAYPLRLDTSLLELNATATSAAFSSAGSTPGGSGGGSSPGGFIEKATSMAIRPLMGVSQIQALLPPRGLFTFPTPYSTTGIRITNDSDCGGADCVESIGYSYWRVVNNHVGSNTMYIFLTLNRGKGGTGPTLFSYDKTTNEVKNLGPLFDASSSLGSRSGEQWYFSATLPTKLYVFESGSGAKLFRYDVISKQTETVFDAAAQYGANRYIWQPHSSNDDKVHSATLRDSSTYQMLGCMVYREDTKQFSFYASQGGFDECHIDKSGRWLTILDNVDGLYGLDNRIVDLQTGAITLVLDQNGAAGHMDTGYGIMVGEDNWDPHPAAVRLYTFGQTPVPGPVVYHATDWSVAGHVSFQNATATTPAGQQFACNSYVNRLLVPRGNEIVCYRLDSSLDVLVVASVMTDLNATGGGSDDYSKMPKGALDITGQYFIWASNMGGARQDAFIVKVPAQLLTGGGSTPPPPPSDTTPPTVSMTTPTAGATVSGAIAVSANASDNVGVAGVQFKLDGANLSAELTAAPYTLSLNTVTLINGAHTLTAVARDAAGNQTTAAMISITVTNGDTTPPAASITSPANGSRIKKGLRLTLPVSAQATDNVGLSKVDVLGDGALIGTVTCSGTSCSGTVSWQVSTLAPGAHSIRAVATDQAGNTGSSTTITVYK